MLLTNTGTISGQKVIYDKSQIEGTSKGESLYFYLDFVKDGSEVPTFSISVREANLGSNYYTLSYPVTGVMTHTGYTLSATGKYAFSVSTGKNIEYVAVDLSLFTTSTLTVDFGLDNYYA